MLICFFFLILSSHMLTSSRLIIMIIADFARGKPESNVGLLLNGCSHLGNPLRMGQSWLFK